MRRIALCLATLLAAPSAHAVDVWSNPFPGVRMLHRTTTQPVAMWALVVDSCAAGVRFRATAPSEGPRVTSSFGRLVGAQLAINGDFADHDFGLNVGNGVRWSSPDTDHSGNFSVGPNRIEMFPDYQVLAAPPAWATEQLGGRWTLLENGVANRGIDDNGPPAGGFVCAPGLRHPRTAIGLSRDKRTVYIIVADGRSSSSIGMTCDELIDVFTELGAYNAMGLDGGGSSTLWRSSGIVNHPSDATGERTVRNHLAIFASGSGPSPQCGLQMPPPTEPPQAVAVAGAALPTVVALTTPSRFVPMNPRRLFDTRGADTSALLTRGDGSNAGPLSVASGGSFNAWSAIGAPSNTSAVWLNVTAVAAQQAGFATVYPDGRPRPLTSNVNFVAANAVANATTVALGSMGTVRFDASTAVEMIADLAGVFTPTGAGFEPIAPVRALDTRSTMVPLRAGEVRMVDVRAPAGAVAVSTTTTVVAQTNAGFLTAFPCGNPTPMTSNVNFTAGAVVANTVVSALGAGSLCLLSSTDTDVIVDVTGYLTPSAALSYVALSPQRLLDTRTNETLFTNRVAAGQTLEIPIARLPGAPSGAGAVVANVTVTDADGAGFLRAFPCGSAPETSSLNFVAGRAASSLVMTALGAGSLCVTSSVRAHVIVDLQGVWTNAPVVQPMPDAGISMPDASAMSDAMTPVMEAAVATDSAQALDAVASPDGTTAADSATARPPAQGSCACRATAPSSPRGQTPSIVGALSALFVAGRRRRRAK